MTYKELCEAVAEEVNRRPLTFSSVSLATETDPFKRSVIRAVTRAYAEVLLYSRHWTFLNQRGNLLTLVGGTRDYVITGVQSFAWSSLYLTEVGGTARYPIVQGQYETWQEMEQSAVGTSGVPRLLIKTTELDKWLFWPTPIKAYVLYGNMQIKPPVLTLTTDTPVWDAQYHDVIVWVAVSILEARVTTTDEVVSTLNATEAKQMASSRFGALCAQFLPGVQPRGSFM